MCLFDLELLLGTRPDPLFEGPSREAWDYASQVTSLHRDPHLPAKAKEKLALALQYERMMRPKKEGDLLAGRIQLPLVSVSPEPGGLGWSARVSSLPLELKDYWAENSSQARLRRSLPTEVSLVLPSDEWQTDRLPGFPLYRIAGIQLDYPRLIRDGLPSEVKELLAPVFAFYGLEGLMDGPPQSFPDALQLFWLYAVCSGTWNYGRLDVALGPILKSDLDGGKITESEALALLQSLWILIAAYDNMWNNRVIVGGKGRPDEEACDLFALLAMEATRTVPLNQPQLSLRFYEGQNPALYQKALDVLAEGRTFPILYNDDVNIPGAAQAFDVSPEEAEQHLPYGCGEYMIWPRTISSPNGVINLPLCLLEAIEEAGSNLEKVWKAYDRRVGDVMDALAVFHRLQYEMIFSEHDFPLIKALYHPQPEWTAAVETYGNTNTADSFCALEHREGAPFYGCDDPRADAWMVRVHEHVCQKAIEGGRKAGIRQLVVQVNNSANVALGKNTPATPDGRGAGEPFANGNNPSPGKDTQGVTALLLSLAKLKGGIHACTVQNMKFSRGLFRDRKRLEPLLEVYWKRGGSQAMITVVDRRDLEAAMEEPEKWGHLMVRVGGFSARFVDLPRDVQLEVLQRTLHE